MNDFLLALKSNVEFELLVKQILKQRPVVPEHNPKQDNTEAWKARSAEQRGFDIWLTHLEIEAKDYE